MTALNNQIMRQGGSKQCAYKNFASATTLRVSIAGHLTN